MAQVLLASMGAVCERLPIVRDEPALIQEALLKAAEKNDLVIISAGFLPAQGILLQDR